MLDMTLKYKILKFKALLFSFAFYFFIEKILDEETFSSLLKIVLNLCSIYKNQIVKNNRLILL